MNSHAHLPVVAVLFAAFTLTSHSHAQSPLVTIDTVTVGDAGNAADTPSYYGAVGAVDYTYNIGKYEVTIGQYNIFLNSVASVTTESYIADLWSAGMADDPHVSGINRLGDGTIADPYTYAVLGGSGDRPITYVSWFDAARFANWMHNGATNGSSTETGAYTLNGATNGYGVTKNAEAKWWIPSTDEWYKAAYYKGGGTDAGYWVYPTQSDSAPGNDIGGATNQANYYDGDWATTQESGGIDFLAEYLTDVGAFSNSASAYGTFDQGGNVAEWNDSASLNVHGGSWFDAIYGPPEGVSGGYSWAMSAANYDAYGRTALDNTIGFRLASVPEPSTYALVLMAGAGCVLWRRRSSNRS
jgi:sulfatase modifying factor 1